jgi:hypothetical protein
MQFKETSNKNLDLMLKQTEDLKLLGFEGFITIKDLPEQISLITSSPGVYLILRPKTQSPDFLSIGSGGHFKYRVPNVPISDLQKNWVDDSIILYIGRSKSLNKRIKQCMKFGQGRKIGHWGGRYIWQLKDAQDLIVCWKPTEENPQNLKQQLIQDFKKEHNGRRPFANLKD